MGDVTKLPQWAQQRIAKLESDVEYYKAQAFQAGKGAGANVVVEAGRDDEHGLPDNARIVFKFGTQRDIEVTRRGDWLEVRSSINGLLIGPDASNVIRVQPKRL